MENNNNSYSWLNSQKNQLIDIIKEQIVVNNKVNFDKEETAKLEPLIDRLVMEDFKVLVMGSFSSGKSTLINACLGRRILPAKALPATAIICEIKYAEKIRCILYPKEKPFTDPKSGLVKNGPFEINVDDLKYYVLIDNKAKQNKEDPALEGRSSPFEKMVLEWPLGICRDGVEIIDSPGLNDPNSHDKITTEYLPNSDAIIYCMSCLQAFQTTDKQKIEELVSLGYKSIIFILTHFDMIQQDPEEEKEFVETRINDLKDYTDLGADGVLFVDSLGGVIGKEEKDDARLRKSKIPEAEKKIEQHLVSQRGKAKLTKAHSQIKSQNSITGSFISEKLKYNSMDLDELKKRQEPLELILSSARDKAGLMIRTLELGIVDILGQSRDNTKVFLNTLSDKIPGWVEEFTPSVSISLWPNKVRSSVNEYVNEYVEHLKFKMQQESIFWAKETLNPMINNNINKIIGNLEELQKAYEVLMGNFQVQMDLGSAKKTEEEITPHPIFQLGSLLYGVFTLDLIGAGMGYTFGLRGLLSSLAAQIATGIILGIASLFTPIGLPAFIIGAIIAGIATGSWNFANLPRRVKNKITESMQTALADRDMQETVITDTTGKIKNLLSNVVKEAKEMYEKEIKPKENALREALIIREQGEKKINEENIRLLEGEKSNREISKNIGSFSLTINV